MTRQPRPRHSARLFLVISVMLVGLAGLPLAAGAQAVLFTAIPSSDFQPVLGEPSTNTYFFGSTDDLSTSCLDNYCEFHASARLPNGAQLTHIEINACRVAGDGVLRYVLLQRGSSSTTLEALAGDFFPFGAGEGCAFHAAYPAGPVVADLFNNEYLLVIGMGEPSLFCGLPTFPPCPSSQPRFQAVRVYYTAPTSGVVEPTTPAPLF